ncbi:serine protease (plasmid) [Sinorhizobium sp. K101]|uniref:serine protease n=2 Tax=unclassified Sinorhizobium TaxID=2613772 RepID=UPI0023D86547|nr:serine protease [Sinorhizobium sp. K101]WEJ14056.1 serine protease [Sinorhizobium sp. K101]
MSRASGRNIMKQQLTLETRKKLYSARRLLPLDVQKETGIRIPVNVYFKDPLVAKTNPAAAIDKNFLVPWEPGLKDGPTSARFAVVDYDATMGTLAPPAKWDQKRHTFVAPNGEALDEHATCLPQFRQLSVWGTVQHTLDFFESGFALGRRITWGFEGNRLILVPAAGYGENAYYDRKSKSLQFYWFERDGQRIYTCHSSDIVNHEFGHAVLDGLRPYYFESILSQTAGFHEFLGDLTAILMAFRNNDFRETVMVESAGDLASGSLLSSLAQQFGDAVVGQPYLRSARNQLTMQDVASELRPHLVSQVLTGAMFDIIIALLGKYKQRQEDRLNADPAAKTSSLAQMFWFTIQRMQMMAIQPLDLLPPCDVTFRDYALAVLRAEQVTNPTDPNGYQAMMLDVFIKRGILGEADRAPLLATAAVFDRPQLAIFHSIDSIGASRGGAYRFLDDNRRDLFIPATADVVVAEIARASKLTTEARQMPDQIVVQYIWREEVVLVGDRFGRFAGERTSMPCGATLVLDQNGNLVHWSRKPGSESLGNSSAERAEQAAGQARLGEFLNAVEARIRAGMIGETIGGELGLLSRATPPFGFSRVDGAIRFELSPHFSIHDDASDELGGRQWHVSS